MLCFSKYSILRIELKYHLELCPLQRFWLIALDVYVSLFIYISLILAATVTELVYYAFDYDGQII